MILFYKLIIFLEVLCLIVKSNSDIIIKYYGFFDFIYRNYQQLIIDNYLEFLWTFDYLTVNLYKNINKERLTNYITNTTSTTNNDNYK